MSKEIELQDQIAQSRVSQRNYEALAKPFIEKQRSALIAEILEKFRGNEDPNLIVRAVGRLAALEDMNQEFKAEIRRGVKASEQLKELEKNGDENAKRQFARRYEGF